jgi:mRNA interferase MazF
MRKTRPVVVVSSDGIGKLPIKLVAPITDWKDAFTLNPWHVRLEPNDENGLTKISAVDTLQLRGVDTQRFTKRLGQLSSEKMTEVIVAIAIIIEHSA